MWFKRSGFGADQDYGIAAGQRFRAMGSVSLVWEVSAVYRYPWESEPHVRLHRVGAASDVKTIALATLRDQRYFAPAG
jgi:hypothetical protein